MRITYIYEHTHFSGLKETWRFSDCTPDQADAAAKEQGWTPPRWWQWWRRDDGPRNFRTEQFQQ